MEKWLIDVQCDGCKGLFYRSAPNVIVPDADWPRNGDVVMGYEISNNPGRFEKLEYPLHHASIYNLYIVYLFYCCPFIV